VPALRDGDLTRTDVTWDPASRQLVSRRGDHRVLVNLGDEPLVHGAGSVVLAWEDLPVVAGSVTVPPRCAAVVRA
jgi:hypothetical protein